MFNIQLLQEETRCWLNWFWGGLPCSVASSWLLPLSQPVSTNMRQRQPELPIQARCNCQLLWSCCSGVSSQRKRATHWLTLCSLNITYLLWWTVESWVKELRPLVCHSWRGRRQLLLELPCVQKIGWIRTIIWTKEHSHSRMLAFLFLFYYFLMCVLDLFAGCDSSVDVAVYDWGPHQLKKKLTILAAEPMLLSH